MAEKVMSKRDQVRERLLKHLGSDNIGAEIGVWRGGFTDEILRVVNPKELYLIDPWIYQPEFINTAFGKSKNKEVMPDYYELVRDKFKDDERIKIMRMTSDDAWEKFDDHYLDWVYLDGNHNSPFIDRDIENALRKVKLNGCISGDDFHWKAAPDVYPVKMAVNKVVERLGDQVHFKTIGSQFLLKLNRE